MECAEKTIFKQSFSVKYQVVRVSPGGSLRARAREQTGERAEILVRPTPLQPLTLVSFHPCTLLPFYPLTFATSHPCILPSLHPLALVPPPLPLCPLTLHEGARVQGCEGHKGVMVRGAQGHEGCKGRWKLGFWVPPPPTLLSAKSSNKFGYDM